MSGNTTITDSIHLPRSRTTRYEFSMTLSPTSTTGSNSPPFTRDSSPSPSISPTPALSACPKLDRSFSATSSATSSATTFSRQSTGSRSSSTSTVLRKRGYVRPQGATFAESARNRDSVLSLGSIAHLQYYFARTGLLDGKGGQLAKDVKKKPVFTPDTSFTSTPPTYDNSDIGSVCDDGDSPVEDEQSNENWDESMMLPPTVSTYSHRVQFLPPPPDSEMLRDDLTKALREADKILKQVEDTTNVLDRRKDPDNNLPQEDAEKVPPAVAIAPGWHEIQGLTVLDVVTLAIRAAKIYYTTHEHPQRLYSIKSERQIREELLGVLDVLKRMASRNFTGGIKLEELQVMQDWIKGIECFIEEENVMEKQEANDRQNWKWLGGSWTAREREREWLFMSSFLPEGTLPEWTNPDQADQHSTPFLKSLRTGLTLVSLQNAFLKRSKRQFGEIKNFHMDTAKPYRCAENLRYWIKAAEIRWETKLKVDVTGVVHSKPEAWADFDAAILQWCKAAREELTKEWREGSVHMRAPDRYPNFHLDGSNG